MIRHALSALLSHWRRHPFQLLALVAGLALATALWSAVQAINGQARDSYAQAAALLGGADREELISDSGRIDTATYAALRRAGWLVTPVMEAGVTVEGRRIEVLGIDPFTPAPGMVPPNMGSVLVDDPSALLVPPGRGFAAPELVASLTTTGALPPLEPAPGLPPRQIVTDISTASLLPGARITRLILLADQPTGTRLSLTEIAPDLRRITVEGESDAARLTDSFHLNLTAFGLLSFAVGLFIVHAGIGLAFEQRRAVIRTLRAVGVPLRTVITAIALELTVLALVAGSVGLLIGYLLAAALLPDVAATLRGLYGAPVSGDLPFRPGWALSGLAIAALGTAVAAGSGLWSIARMPLLAPARPRAWARASTAGLRRQALAGALLIAAGVAVALVLDGLIAGFALLGGLLMGSALVLPLFLSGALHLGAALSRSALTEWFWADARQQLRGLSLALMALMLALATNVGVGTMVSSFRLTFTGWLDQRLSADLYLSTRSEVQTAQLTAWAAANDARLLPVISVEAPLAGRPGDIFGVVDDPLYAQSWPMLSGTATPWQDLRGTGAVIINEQLARGADLSVGDTLTLGPGWTAPIAGVYSDYGNPEAQAIVALPELDARHPELPRLRFGLVTATPEAAQDALEEIGLSPGQITDQASIKALSLSIFEQTFAVTAALNVLTLGVAGFAIFTSLTTLAGLRLPQLAPVWALGMRRARLARLELARAGMLAALTFALALPVGLVLAWVLLAVVNVEAFGWRLPMHLFPGQWVWLAGAALIATVLAAALPARALSRRAPAEFLKVFADER